MSSVVAAEWVCANTEDELIERARVVMSSCNWQLGAIAASWTQRFAKGRTDAAFGELIGLSADQVYQRRRVWETFADVYLDYPALKWSHFCVALTWDDAAACLGWAEEMQATVSEMRAWRRATHGEDLSQEADGGRESGDDTDALAMDEAESRGPAVSISDIDGASEQAPYAPFSKTASPDAARRTDPESREAEAPDYERLAGRLAKQLAACEALLSPELIEQFSALPCRLQDEITQAIDHLSATATMLPLGRV